MNDYINDEIYKYQSQIPKLIIEEKKLDKIRQTFVDDYSVDHIKGLSKEEYCIGFKTAGFKNYRTFCYRIENELNELGEIHGSPSRKFCVYYGKPKRGSKERTYLIKNGYGSDLNDALEIVKGEICELIEFGAKNDTVAITQSPLEPLFKYKILNTYYPDRFFAIYNENHIDEFLTEFGISFPKEASFLDKQRLLFAEKNKNVLSRKWSNYIFMWFLYERISIPSREDKKVKDEQKELDKQYSKKYQYNIPITKEQWKIMLKNKDIFHEENIQLMKDIYFCHNHASTCKNLEIMNGVPAQSYNKPVVALARRVLEYTKNKAHVENGKEKYWDVLFWGNYVENNRFEWKLKPDLVAAIEEAFPNLKSLEINEELDNKLNDDLRKNSNFSKLSGEYSKDIKDRPKESFINGQTVYKRDRSTALNALKIAKFECQYDHTHKSFIRKNSGIKYTEPHHLIPMAAQRDFDVSIDIEENIISLCSDCHNRIHYGKDAEMLIRKLYSERKELLEKKRIYITIEKLLSYYGYK